MPCCETPGKPCLQVPLSVLHVSGSLLQRTRAAVDLSDTSHSGVLVWVCVSGSSAKPAEVTQLKNFALHPFINHAGRSSLLLCTAITHFLHILRSGAAAVFSTSS